MRKHHFRIFLPVSIVLIVLTSVPVMRADVTGSISGVVRDRSQAVIAGAHIVATNVETNLSRETTSDPDGSYRILALPAGHYKHAVTAQGFRTFTETDIVVKVNDELRFDVTLDVGNITETVEITANAVQVQTENTQLGHVIDSKKMLALPLNGGAASSIFWASRRAWRPAPPGQSQGLFDKTQSHAQVRLYVPR